MKQPLGVGKIKTVYIAGPMDGYENYNYDAFFKAEDILRNKGYVPVNPAKIGIIEGWTKEQYLKVNIEMVSNCDAIYLLKNWNKSDGSLTELYHAIKNGLEIIVEDTDPILDRRVQAYYIDSDFIKNITDNTGA